LAKIAGCSVPERNGWAIARVKDMTPGPTAAMHFGAFAASTSNSKPDEVEDRSFALVRPGRRTST
jgi:hypothetical protein